MWDASQNRINRIRVTLNVPVKSATRLDFVLAFE